MINILNKVTKMTREYITGPNGRDGNYPLDTDWVVYSATVDAYRSAIKIGFHFNNTML